MAPAKPADPTASRADPGLRRKSQRGSGEEATCLEPLVTPLHPVYPERSGGAHPVDPRQPTLPGDVGANSRRGGGLSASAAW